MNATRRNGTRRRPRQGFSLAELLIVVSLIVLLVSLILVATTRTRGAAEAASTAHTLQALKTGLTQFNDDFGYYPPLLSDRPELMTVVTDQGDREDLEYYSTLTLPAYLLGIGDLNDSGDDEQFEMTRDWYNDGQVGIGFRDPGVDRSWGGARSAGDRSTYLQSRYGNLKDDEPEFLKGRVYGPYVDLTDEYVLTRAKTDREGNALDGDGGRVLYQFQDYWEAPIRYYRDWPPCDDCSMDEFETKLAPWFGSVPEDEREGLLMRLRSTPYVLLSPGPDGQVNTEDPNAIENQDNVVELGLQ